MTQPAIIAVDWGTTSFRAWLLNAAGRALDVRTAPEGIQATRGRFSETLAGQISQWPTRIPVLMAGMIGSRQGWHEAPYLQCPVRLPELAASLTRVPTDDRDVLIVPGLMTPAQPHAEVMRGEETQVFGAIEHAGVTEGIFALPGTHSKWVTVRNRVITSFSTFMTGELYAACRDHTILGRLMVDGPASPGAFERGVMEGAAEGSAGALLNRLFRVRTAGLMGRFAEAELPDYLSGMLIGAEFTAARDQVAEPVYLVASASLADRYATAARILGVETVTLPADCVLDGFMSLARAAGLAETTRNPV